MWVISSSGRYVDTTVPVSVTGVDRTSVTESDLSAGYVYVWTLRIWLTVLSVWLAQKQTDSWEHQQHRINSGVGLYSSAVSTCVCDWHRCNQCDTEDVTIHLEGRPAFLNVLHWEYWDFLPDTVNSLSGHEHLHSNKMIFFYLAGKCNFLHALTFPFAATDCSVHCWYTTVYTWNGPDPWTLTVM